MLQPSTRKPNALIHAASPYLLQHAYNPVDWLPWSTDALQKAESENKLILVSIGYSACHWCHVMERECFEDSPTAEIMNAHFICIKIDREERPDIDQLYMSAVHLMGQRGGWPLNCIALPDGRPVYGGTYFPKSKWQQILLEIARIYKENKGELLDYAERLANGIRQTELFKISNDSNEITPKDLEDSIATWKNEFDTEHGGPNRAPKFPLPSNYVCLLRYGFLTNDASVKNHVQLSLDKMASGGIYDQIAGGFSRYSTDIWWKVPHFEKMLYDNAQLISLYAEASVAFGNERYAEVCKQTINWLQNELHNGQGGYYSALDADSEGIEGKFYLWTEDELQQLLNEDELSQFKKWYNLNEESFWEEGGGHILISKETSATSVEMKNIQSKLLKARNHRERPGTDDKTILSWNAMTANALADASRFLNEREYLDLARKTIEFIEMNMMEPGYNLKRIWKNGKASVEGFLEDYVWLTRAYIALFLADFEKTDFEKAIRLHTATCSRFPEAGAGLLYFTQESQDVMVVRQLETADNVIPASNSILAENALLLAKLSGNAALMDSASRMLKAVRRDVIGYGQGASQWIMLAMGMLYDPKELVVIGKGAHDFAKKQFRNYRPNISLLCSENSQDWGLFSGRIAGATLTFYLCEKGSCNMPVSSEEDLKKQLEAL